MNYRNLRDRTKMKREQKYVKDVEDFNKASGACYSADVHFLTFRKTSSGVLVGYTCGKAHEVYELVADVAKAGAPYYTKL